MDFHVVVNDAKALFDEVINGTETLNEQRVKIENLHEEMALNLKELKEKIRIAREEANNVCISLCIRDTLQECSKLLALCFPLSFNFEIIFADKNCHQISGRLC